MNSVSNHCFSPSSNPSLQAVVRNNGHHGVWVYAGNTLMTGGSVTGNTGHGVHAVAGATVHI